MKIAMKKLLTKIGITFSGNKVRINVRAAVSHDVVPIAVANRSRKDAVKNGHPFAIQ